MNRRTNYIVRAVAAGVALTAAGVIGFGGVHSNRLVNGIEEAPTVTVVQR